MPGLWVQLAPLLNSHRLTIMYKSHQVMTKFQPGEEVLVYVENDDAMVRGVVVQTHAFLGSCPAAGQRPEWGVEYRVAFRGHEQMVPEQQLIPHDRWTIEFPPLKVATEPLTPASEPVGQPDPL